MKPRQKPATDSDHPSYAETSHDTARSEAESETTPTLSKRPVSLGELDRAGKLMW